MSLGHAMRRAASGVATGDDGFFGSISMLREFWAEDPSWSNPGDGNKLVTLRDNGTLAEDLTAYSNGGGDLKPTYADSGINSKPSIVYNATANSTGGYLQTTQGANPNSSSPGHTVVAVAKVGDHSWWQYITDGYSEANSRHIIGCAASLADWRGYCSSNLNVLDGTPDTSAHLFVLRALRDDLELWVDGVLIGTDTVGLASSSFGFTIGGDIGGAAALVEGEAPYVAQYDGDLTAHGSYATYTAAIASYYSITI